MLVDLANQSAADGHGVSVCLIYPGDELAGALRKGIQIWKLNCVDGSESPAMSRFTQIVTRSGATILHVHGRAALKLLWEGNAKYPVRTPVVFHDHFGGIETDASIAPWFRSCGSKLVSHYVGVCARLGVWAEDAGVAKQRISVIENALDLSRLTEGPATDVRSELGIAEEVPLGIVVGGLRPNKGLDVLLDAMARLVPRWSFKILVAGGTRDREYVEVCRRKIQQLGLGQHILMLGERRDVLGVLRSVDFAVHPARSESGPLVLIEYAANAVPLVASRAGDISQRLEAWGIPEFVPPGDAAALAAALERLLSLSPGERKQRGDLGREVALREFDIRNRMSRWYEIYKQAAG